MAEEEGKEEGKEGGEHAEAPKSKKKLIIIIAVVLVVVLGAVGFLLMGGKSEEHPAEEEHHEEEKHYAHAELATLIVNLSETSNFLKVRIMLEYDPEVLAKAAGGAAHGGEEEGGHGGGGGPSLPGVLGHREPMIQDGIIKVLSSKRAADVLTVEGKEQIKEELIEAINEASGLEEPAVVAIYFREFIVQ